MEKIITRFAPSPTGHLHIGGLRTALFSYLYAKKNQGEFLLRIEDTDSSRNSQEAVEAILQAFEWVGLKNDREIQYQSQRFHIYKQYIQQLLDEKKAYYCYMSEEELNALRQEQKAKKMTPRYDNRYRDFTGTPPKGVHPVVRIKAPLKGTIEFNDGVKGKMCFQATEVDDFIIARSDGSPTYNFVVAIDDALMGVNHIVRGDDHLSNTPKQIVIYQALNFKIPQFYHVPMILGSDGQKLSKRHGAKSVMEYKAYGYLPEALLNFLIRLGWSYGDEEIFSLKEMLEKFDLKDLNTSPSIYNQDKLNWINQHYIKNCDSQRLQSLLIDLIPSLQAILTSLSSDQKNLLFSQLKDREKTLLDFGQKIQEIFHLDFDFDTKMIEKAPLNASEILEKFDQSLTQTHSLEIIKDQIHTFAQKFEIKQGVLMPLLRLALLRKPGGIGVAEAIFILGKQNSSQRIQELKAKLQTKD